MTLRLIDDVGAEELIPQSDLPSSGLIPRERRGKKTAVSTFYRWAAQGCHGIQLPVIRAGNILCTTKTELLNFYRQLTNRNAPRVRPATKRRETPRALDQLGVK